MQTEIVLSPVSIPQTNMSMPPQESSSTVPSLGPTASGAAHTILSMPGQASSRENPSQPSATTTILGAAQTVLSSSATHHPTCPQGSVPQEHAAEGSVPADVPQRSVELSHRPPISISTQVAGGSRANTPPRGAAAHGTRSYPSLPHHTRPIPVPIGTVYRRSTAPYLDSETAWNGHDEKDHLREKPVGERLDPAIKSAKDELAKAKATAKWAAWAHHIALTLQMIIGALTTALGAALSGKHSSVAISVLGGLSTLITSFLARMRGTNEPHASLLRAQALEHLLRDIDAFQLDHGHEFGDKWDSKINGFRFGLERILGNHPGTNTVNGNAVASPSQEKGVEDPSFDSAYSGNGKSPVTGADAKLEPMDV